MGSGAEGLAQNETFDSRREGGGRRRREGEPRSEWKAGSSSTSPSSRKQLGVMSRCSGGWEGRGAGLFELVMAADFKIENVAEKKFHRKTFPSSSSTLFFGSFLRNTSQLQQTHELQQEAKTECCHFLAGGYKQRAKYAVFFFCVIKVWLPVWNRTCWFLPAKSNKCRAKNVAVFSPSDGTLRGSCNSFRLTGRLCENTPLHKETCCPLSGAGTQDVLTSVALH